MMINANAICDNRPILVDSFDTVEAYWGSGVVCCANCESILAARQSWGKEYNVIRMTRTPNNDPFYVR